MFQTQSVIFEQNDGAFCHHIINSWNNLPLYKLVPFKVHFM